VRVAAEVVCRSDEFDPLWEEIIDIESRPRLDEWALGERRARLDAQVALAYELSLPQLAAVLCTFPNLDTIQPRLPGEPKSFVTRDLALLAYCQELRLDPPDIVPALRPKHFPDQ